MYTKAKIFNLALGALLLSRQIENTDTDTSKECKVLNTHWDTAFRATLEDLDLDSTATQADLELIEEDPNDLWNYSYKYPSKCVFFRRIQTTVLTDTRATRVPLRISVKDGIKVIFTNAEEAVGEYIPHDIPLSSLSANVGLCIAYKLAILSAPLVTGKGAAKLREEIQKNYTIAKMEAQEQDQRENMNFLDDDTESEFVAARTE